MRLAVVSLVTALCVVAALWGLEPRAVLDAALSVRAAALPPALLFALGVFLLRVLRFGLLLGAVRPGAADLLSACGVGLFALQLLPLRLGELVRPWLLARRGVPFARCLGAIAVERLMDLLALVGMLLLVGQVELPGRLEVAGLDVLRAGQRAATVGIGVLGLALLGLVLLGGRADLALARLPVVGPRLAGVATSAADAVRGLGAARGLAALLATVGIWGTNIAMVQALLGGWPDLPARPEVALTVAAATIAGILAVPTPGMVGAFELFGARTLGLWPVSAEAATAFALVWHALLFGLHAVLGGALLVREGTSLGAVVRASRSGGPAAG